MRARVAILSFVKHGRPSPVLIDSTGCVACRTWGFVGLGRAEFGARARSVRAHALRRCSEKDRCSDFYKKNRTGQKERISNMLDAYDHANTTMTIIRPTADVRGGGQTTGVVTSAEGGSAGCDCPSRQRPARTASARVNDAACVSRTPELERGSLQWTACAAASSLLEEDCCPPAHHQAASGSMRRRFRTTTERGLPVAHLRVGWAFVRMRCQNRRGSEAVGCGTRTSPCALKQPMRGRVRGRCDVASERRPSEDCRSHTCESGGRSSECDVKTDVVPRRWVVVRVPRPARQGGPRGGVCAVDIGHDAALRGVRSSCSAGAMVLAQQRASPSVCARQTRGHLCRMEEAAA